MIFFVILYMKIDFVLLKFKNYIDLNCNLKKNKKKTD